MKNIQAHVVSQDISIAEALKALNNLPGDELNLFVRNDESMIVGSVTDGDIRRALITGATLDTPLHRVANMNFAYFVEGETDVLKLRDYKRRGITMLPILDDQHHLVNIYNLRRLKSLLPIDAVLMAGGKGERLLPMTAKTPKPLLKIGEKAIIDYNVDRMLVYGIQHIHVTVNYLHGQVEEHFKGNYQDVPVHCVQEPRFLGTIGAVSLIEDFHHDTVLVMNSDLFTDIDLEDFYCHFISSGADMSAAAVPYTMQIPYGIFDVEGEQVVGVREKPTYNYYANAGIYLLKREVLEMIPHDEMFDSTDLMEQLIACGKKVVRYPLAGYWIDIGRKEEYDKACEIAKHLKF